MFSEGVFFPISCVKNWVKSSIFLLPYIDGAIGHQTSIANHTIFLDKPFFSISDSYTKSFSDDVKLSRIKEYFDQIIVVSIWKLYDFCRGFN